MSDVTGLPAELERLLDDWFRSGADSEWAELLPSLPGVWTAPGGLETARGAEQAGELLTGDRDLNRTLYQRETDPLASTPMVSSTLDKDEADSSLPSTSGDDVSDEKSERRATEVVARSPRKVPGKPARNASRERMKNELRYLRQRALELETQLAGLKSSSVEKQRDEQEGGLRSVWKQIAERQLARRRQIEIENDRLKGMLAEYLVLARRLEQFLYKRPRPEQLLCDDADASILLKKTRMTASIDVDDEALLLRFVGELDEAFTVVDSVFGTSNALNEASTNITPFQPILKTKTSSNGRQVPYLELNGACVIPFPFERAHKAAWISAKRRYQRDEYVTYAVDHPDDTIAVRFSLQYQGRAVDNIVVIRRYESKDRTVLIWRSLSECGDECKHVLTDETGWCVFRSSPAAGENPSSTTVMRSCIHVVPIQRVTHEPSELAPKEISALSAMLANTYVNDEAAISSMVEDLLLDAPLRF